MGRDIDALMKRIGPWLRDLRVRKGISQSQLSVDIARDYGIELEPSRYSQMERGREGPPTLKSFLSMLDYFGADVSALLEPGARNSLSGLEYIHSNARLVEELMLLRDTWGEEAAARLLLTIAGQVNELREGDRGRGRRIRAARPPRGSGGRD